mmetsp:Transcript_9499/g.15644  ORF Transcript_9499/g.15644 Transcript_9499/m.15644 type:complete len:202 (+) Transcript_9499:285-890(+)
MASSTPVCASRTSFADTSALPPANRSARAAPPQEHSEQQGGLTVALVALVVVVERLDSDTRTRYWGAAAAPTAEAHTVTRTLVGAGTGSRRRVCTSCRCWRARWRSTRWTKLPRCRTMQQSTRRTRTSWWCTRSMASRWWRYGQGSPLHLWHSPLAECTRMWMVTEWWTPLPCLIIRKGRGTTSRNLLITSTTASNNCGTA